PSNDPVSYTNRTSASTTVTVQPPAPEVATTETTGADVVLERGRAPLSASVQPDVSSGHPDRQLSDRIGRTLGSDQSLRGVALDRVRIRSVDGHVTLHGLVPTLADKVAIEQRVREVKGVTAVNNAIEVLR
ncbi:MAG: hypothetical protein K0S65_2995, partial [Labilithrix sp.]|nr:hypothetical protein [Labilithrix sp.]